LNSDGDEKNSVHTVFGDGDVNRHDKDFSHLGIRLEDSKLKEFNRLS